MTSGGDFGKAGNLQVWFTMNIGGGVRTNDPRVWAYCSSRQLQGELPHYTKGFKAPRPARWICYFSSVSMLSMKLVLHASGFVS